MTEQLYYKDSTRLEFEAVIVSSRAQDERFVTVLDRSAFYPTSGGQLHDVGWLNDVPVVDVMESDEGEVWHVTAESVGRPGDRVKGVVDQLRRRRHCQTHTAQHILSAVFVKLYDLETVSMHLGEEYAAIELPVKSISDEQVQAAERRANEIISSNAPVEIKFVDRQQAADLPLRKTPGRSGTLRIIGIGDFDYSACGGTHCRGTAEVGLVKVTGWEKIRGNTLVKFLAGDLAVEDYARRFTITDRLTRSFTCHLNDLEGRVSKLTDENKELRRSLAAAQKELLPIRVRELAGTAQTHGSLPWVGQIVDDVDTSLAATMAGEVASEIKGLAVLIIGGRLIIAVASGTELHAGNLARELAARTGLKGGGSEKVAQIGGADAARLAEYVKTVLSLIDDA